MTVSLENTWGPATRQEIGRHLELRKVLHHHQLPEPLKVTVPIPARPKVVQRIKSIFSHAPRFLSVEDSEPEAHVVCTLSGDRLTILFKTMTGAVFHSMRKADDDGVAKRIALAIIVSAANFGALNQAAQLWNRLPDLSDAVTDLQVASIVVSMLARAGDMVALREFIERVSPRLGQGPLTATLYSLYWSAPQHRGRDIASILIELEQGDLKSPEAKDRSIAHYNLARLTDDKPGQSVRHFAAAIRESNFYGDKAYFWKELGSSLFSQHRYEAALKCYRCAYERLGYTERRSHFADALMHTGRYEEALKMFREVHERPVNSQANPAEQEEVLLDHADAVIKVVALTEIVQKHGHLRQKRQRWLANEVLGDSKGISDDEIVLRADKAIALDALCGRAWFNRAIALRDQRKQDSAFLSFVAAAAVNTSDDEAWANALFLALEIAKDFVPYIIQFVRHQRGEAFVRFLAQTAQRHADAAQATAILEVARLFGDQLPKESVRGTMRIHHPDGPPTIFSWPKE
jgi:tetratricopeptide (TPR) repeat protein